MDTKILAILCGIVLLGVAGFVAYKTNAFGPTAPDAPLVNTYWKLTELNGTAFAMPSGMTKEPHFVLQVDNNRMVGFGGCNRMSGSYLLVGNKLSFPDNIAITRMACPDIGDVEQSFVQALRSSVSWKVQGTTLELRDRNGNSVGTFEQTLMD